MAEGPVFYHGTRRGFTRGGYLTPRRFHGGQVNRAPIVPGKYRRADADDFVFMTTSLELAWAYAFEGVGRGQPKVLVLEPQGEIESDPEHGEDMQAYRSREWARVVEVLTDPPFTEAEARSGWVLT